MNASALPCGDATGRDGQADIPHGPPQRPGDRALDNLARQWLSEQRDRLTIVALLRRDIINFSMCRPQEPVTLEDLLPSEEQKPQKARRMTAKRRQQIADKIRARMALLPHFVVAEGA